MLANDSVTIAVAFDWLTPADIDALELSRGVPVPGVLRLARSRGGGVGHIDYSCARAVACA